MDCFCEETFRETARFHEGLRKTGSYRSAPVPARSRLDLILGRFDAWYYLRLARIIYSGHRAALRGDYDTRHWAANSFSVLRLIEGCGGRIEIAGMEHVFGLGRSAVYVGNHMSIIEALLLPAMLTHVNHLAAVVKDSLLKYPFFGTFVRAVDPISVGRRNPRDDLKAVLQKGSKALRSGRSVFLVPQATRHALFDPSTFNTLGVKLAKSAGAPMIPVAIRTDFLGVGRIVKDIGPLDRTKTIRFRFGRPLTVSGNGREAHEKAVGFIAETMRSWGLCAAASS